MTDPRKLPDFIKPMLAQTGKPFDSPRHLFEIKWDGIRAMAYIDEGVYRLLTRRGHEITSRYPEFFSLAELSPGTVLDGEIVVLDEAGKPDFRAVLTREQARSPQRFRSLAKATPATFVVFDLLYLDYRDLMQRPLRERRELLLANIAPKFSDRVVLSDGVVGAGTAFFREAVSRDLEGVVAKRLDSRYFPGRRTDAWIKIRKRSTALCAILGYVPKGDDFESLILAEQQEGELRCVGRVGTGFDAALRDRLNRLLRERETEQPLVRCAEKGKWLEPGMYCQVLYLQRSKDGMLREPVFERLILDGERAPGEPASTAQV